MICPEDTSHHHRREKEDEATMDLLEELSLAGFEVYNNPRTTILDDEIIPAWVLALVGEGAATVDSSPATEEEPVVDGDSEFTSWTTVEAVNVVGSGRSAQQLPVWMEEEMAAEEEDFASYISDWESSWGASGCGHFPDMSELARHHHPAIFALLIILED
jgi:hypothetical protein